jgi:WD40 repeat protein
VAVSSDGRTALTGSKKQGAVGNETETTILWDLTNPVQPVRRAVLPVRTGAGGVALTADGRTALTASDANRAILWNLTNPDHPAQRAILNLPGPSYGQVQQVALSADGRTALIVVGNAFLWDLTDPDNPAQYTVLTGPDLPDRPDDTSDTDHVSAAALAPDGRTALIGHYFDKTVNLWDLTDPAIPTRRATLTDHPGPVSSLALSADSRTALTGSEQSAFLWDLTDPASPARSVLPVHAEHVGEMALSADGRTALIGRTEPTLWNFSEVLDMSAHLIDRACAASAGGLTHDEWSRYVPDSPYISSCR